MSKNKSSTSQPLVTILTPVYNGEKYLSECIESALTQTYENWEYIIVNNCSTDRSLEIAQSYAQKDTRIRIHNNQEFVGVIENHHIGFRQISSRSKYCKVVQADDWLFPQCIMEMIEIAEAHPSVSIVGSYGLYNSEVKCDGLDYPSTVVSGREICRSTLLGKIYLFLSASSLLIRSDIIRNQQPFYTGPYLHADVGAYYEVLRHSDFGFVHQVLTYVRKHQESMTSSVSNRVNSIILANLYFIAKYGPIYLGREEHRVRLNWMVNDYYRFLAKSAFQLRGKKFWVFHKHGLKEMNMHLSAVKLMIAMFLYAADYVFNLKQTASKLFRSTHSFVNR